MANNDQCYPDSSQILFLLEAPMITQTLTPFLLLVYASGGWDPTMVFDPKLESPYVSQELGATLAQGPNNMPYVHHPDRPGVKAWMDKYGDHAAFVNGVYVGSMEQSKAAQRMLSVTPPDKNYPVDWLAFYAANLNPTLVAPYLIMDTPHYPGHLPGVSYPVSLKEIQNLGTQTLPEAEKIPANVETLMEAYKKTEMTKFLGTVAEGSFDGDKAASLAAASLRYNPLTSALGKIIKDIKPAGTESDFLISGKVAVEMFAGSNSLCAAITHGKNGQWNTYADHFKTQSALYESLFSDLEKIMSYGETKGVLASMVIVVLSDRGRAPKLNEASGKGPWPYTSMVLWGPGIKPSAIAGKTDAALRGIPIDPVFGTEGGANAVLIEASNVFASLYLRYNLPSKLLIPDTKPLSSIIQMESKP